jgi:hypothetical protein
MAEVGIFLDAHDLWATDPERFHEEYNIHSDDHAGRRFILRLDENDRPRPQSPSSLITRAASASRTGWTRSSSGRGNAVAENAVYKELLRNGTS